MIPYNFWGHSDELYVKQYFPNAYIKDEKFLSRVVVDINGLSTWTEISSNLTDDRAWTDAAMWIEDNIIDKQ